MILSCSLVIFTSVSSKYISSHVDSMDFLQDWEMCDDGSLPILVQKDGRMKLKPKRTDKEIVSALDVRGLLSSCCYFFSFLEDQNYKLQK